MKKLLSILFLLFSGCDLFNSGEEIEEPSFEYFTATLNGKDIIAEPRGGIFNKLDNLYVLQVIGLTLENEKLSHLYYDIKVIVIYNESKTHYSVLPTDNPFYHGGRITEWDYDVVTGIYNAYDDGEEHEFTVFRDQTPEGRE